MRTTCAGKLYVTISMFEVHINGKKVGQFGIQLGTDSANIYNVQIRDDLRGRGLGYKMMKKALRMAARYRSVARLCVSTGNEPAIRLYKKLGFEEYRSKDSSFNMEKKLW